MRRAADPDVRLERGRGGYVLVVERDRVDLHRFTALVADARATADDRVADARFAEALGLWRGDALTVLDRSSAAGSRTNLGAGRVAQRALPLRLDPLPVR